MSDQEWVHWDRPERSERAIAAGLPHRYRGDLMLLTSASRPEDRVVRTKELLGPGDGQRPWYRCFNELGDLVDLRETELVAPDEAYLCSALATSSDATPAAQVHLRNVLAHSYVWVMGPRPWTLEGTYEEYIFAAWRFGRESERLAEGMDARPYAAFSSLETAAKYQGSVGRTATAARVPFIVACRLAEIFGDSESLVVDPVPSGAFLIVPRDVYRSIPDDVAGPQSPWPQRWRLDTVFPVLNSIQAMMLIGGGSRGESIESFAAAHPFTGMGTRMYLSRIQGARFPFVVVTGSMWMAGGHVEHSADTHEPVRLSEISDVTLIAPDPGPISATFDPVVPDEPWGESVWNVLRETYVVIALPHQADAERRLIRWIGMGWTLPDVPVRALVMGRPFDEIGDDVQESATLAFLPLAALAYLSPAGVELTITGARPPVTLSPAHLSELRRRVPLVPLENTPTMSQVRAGAAAPVFPDAPNQAQVPLLVPY